MDNSLKLNIHRAWGSLRKNGRYPPFFPAAQPVSLERRHIPLLYSRNYFVSEKSDGIRMGFICLGSDVMFVNRKMETFPVNFKIPREFFKGTMFDGEMMSDGSYVVYDAVMIQGENIRQCSFLKRLYYIRRIIDQTPFFVKKFYFMRNFKYFLDNVSSDRSDGFIFTPIYEPVGVATQITLFKWKSVDNITIDFMVKGGKLWIQERNSPIYFGCYSWVSDYSDGDIVECRYVDCRWFPLKLRTDKDYPNSLKTFNKTMLSIRENVCIQDILLCSSITE